MIYDFWIEKSCVDGARIRLNARGETIEEVKKATEIMRETLKEYEEKK